MVEQPTKKPPIKKPITQNRVQKENTDNAKPVDVPVSTTNTSGSVVSSDNTIKEESKFNRPTSWLKDNSKKIVWSIVSIPNCDWTQKALELLREHGEEHIHHQTHSESTAQEAITKGINYSPCIYQNGKLIGSYKELESYYSRNYFSTMRQGAG